MDERRMPASGGRFFRGALVAMACLALVASGLARGDEGMWLFNQPPLERLEKDHGFKPTPEWLLHLQQSSVRFNSGGSGSFVSADGLVLTNHHVGADSLQKLGDDSHDYYRDGFAAVTRDDELRCHDLELNVLMSIEDVTQRVQGAVEPGMSADDAFAARRKAMATIEQESLEKTGLRSDVVTLFQGGAYHLYRAKKYTDVRLVFAPERQIAFFGGDADNFEFPRFNLDMCLFRAYENGKPAKVEHFLAWGSEPVREGELVFVSGHPGHTDRANTMRELVAMRDRQMPMSLAMLRRLEVMLGVYSGQGPEEARQASEDLFGVQNSRKAREGLLSGLLDPRVMARKEEAERYLREEMAKSATTRGKPTPFARIEDAEKEIDSIALRYNLLEGGAAFNSKYFSTARAILRAAEEQAKGSGERLREFRESARESMELGLFSDEPVYDALETVKLADSLTFMVGALGVDDATVKAVLAGKSPRDRAAELVKGTGLGKRPVEPGRDPVRDTRREIYQAGLDGGAKGVEKTGDPMIALAAAVDGEARRLRKIMEAVREVKQQAHAEITQAQYAILGDGLYPDATFTLRLAYGTVKGYEHDGKRIDPITHYAGLFDRATLKKETPPFDLPSRWQTQRKELEANDAFLKVPFNFVSTADIIGGNSGSPVVNRDGELVGLIFDGNIQSLILDVAYDDRQSRAVSVDAAGILAALRTVYKADGIVAELTAAQQPPRARAAAAGDAGWKSLFDGESLGGWKSTSFGGEGEIAVEDGSIMIGRGSDMSGITWTKDVPKQNYEIELEAQRVDGNDFFCGLTFPVGDDPCSFIVGGWGGGVVGLSSIDGQDAAHNSTTSYKEFKSGRWYTVRVRVTPERIACWLDDEQVVDQKLANRIVSIRNEVFASKPLGIATYSTVARVKNIRVRPVGAGAEPVAEGADAAQDE